MAGTIAVTMEETTSATIAKTTPADTAEKGSSKEKVIVIVPLTAAQKEEAKICFNAADAMIAQAVKTHLPPMPHLLELPEGTKSILSDKVTLEKLPNESRNTLAFNEEEWKHMQYMTYVNVNSRGITTTRGAWEDDMKVWQLTPEQLEAEARSRSNSSTPKEGQKKGRKWTTAEYIHFRKTGEKPASQRATASPTPDTQASTNPNSVNDVSLSAELEQVLSSSSAEVMKDGAKSSVGTTKEVEKVSSQPSQAPLAQVSSTNGPISVPVASTSMPATNGNTAPVSHAKSIAGTENGLKATLEKPMVGHNATNGIAKSTDSGKTITNGLSSSSKNGMTTNGNVPSSNSQSASKSGIASSLQAPKDQPVSRTNGVSGSREALQSKESNKDVTRPANSATRNNSTLPKNPITGKSSNDASKPSLSATSASFSQQTSQKRPPPPDHGPAEKRAKFGHSGASASSTQHSRPPSNPYNPVRKPDPSGLPPRPNVSAGPTSYPLGGSYYDPYNLYGKSVPKTGHKDVRKAGSTPRPGRSATGTPRSDTPRSDMTRELPPPLSPLHAGFESSPLSEPPASSAPPSFSKIKKSEDAASSAKKPVDKGKGVARKQAERSGSPDPDNLSRPLPNLLSPSLPAAVEEALNEVKNQKKAFATVEQRHEFARQDGAPGVARVVKTRNSRKTVAAPEPEPQDDPEESEEEDDHNLTTLKFKKKNRSSVDWMTKSRPQPGRGLTNKPLPGGYRMRSQSSDDADDAPLALTAAAKRKRQNDDDDYDAPPARKTTRKQRAVDEMQRAIDEDDMTLTNTAPKKKRADEDYEMPQAKAVPNKKRVPDSNDTTSEPASKRAKAEPREVARTAATASTGRKSTPVSAARTSTPVPPARISTPLPAARPASPASSAPSNRSLLATPKRGDAMRSVAMRKVDSSEGLARTPQSMEITPGSVDRSRVNPTSEPRFQNSAEYNKLHTVALSAEVLALKIKRKMDDLLKTKSQDPLAHQQVSEKDKKQGLATGIESIIVYMNCFFRQSRILTLSEKPRLPHTWTGIVGLIDFIIRQSQDFPVLHALAYQLSAICRDHLERSYMDQKDPAKRLESWDAMEQNNKQKVASWNMSEEKNALLLPFSGGTTLGPWSDIKDITSHTICIITAYSRKEQSGWRKDPEFSALLS